MSNRQTCCVTFSADINECKEGRDDCHEWATCINTIGSYKCMCNPGSTGDGVDCIGENMAMYSVHFGSVIVCVSVYICLSFILKVQAVYMPSKNLWYRPVQEKLCNHIHFTHKIRTTMC